MIVALKNISVICLVLGSFISSAFAEHQPGHQDGKNHRDNRALFPAQQADPSQSTTPDMVVLVEPKFMTSTTADAMTLKWNEALNADSYHIQVATDPNFKWLIADEVFFKGTTFEVKGLEKGKHYYWRVAGMKSTNISGRTKGPFQSSMFATK